MDASSSTSAPVLAGAELEPEVEADLGFTRVRTTTRSVAEWLATKRLHTFADAIIAEGFEEVAWFKDQEEKAIEDLAAKVGMQGPAQASFKALWKELQAS